ncbi:MAG: homocysteine S-methyltransferase family protein, partial [Erysipelotrichaceae bacterium]|nr:homocysteine S-methyltransferase family protein [Erysipelotrichaceae bacterium]
MTFLDKLGKQWLYYDGATGSIIQSKGLKMGELPETWNIKRPDDIIDVYSSYLNAGSDIILTNTFGANRLKFADNLKEIVTCAIKNAQIAKEKTNRPDAFIALDIGPTGKLLEPLGDLAFEDAVSLFAETVRYGVEAGADLIHIETMQDMYELKAAVLAAKENSDLPVVTTVVFDETGKMLTGGTPEAVVAMLEGLGVDALGVNCSLGPEQMYPMIKRITDATSLPVVVKPNAGLPKTDDQGQTYYDLSAEDFVKYMVQIATELPVHALGGCCGTTPEFIKQLKAATKDLPLPEVACHHKTVVTSFAKAVEIDVKPVIIGERINPTGKKRFQQALRERDYGYILSEALKQEDSGADILDVNVGLPEIDEPAMIVETIKQLQGVTALPLQIDTTDPIAMEQAMRYYNGKPMINSVNGKQEIMDAIFPLVKKYGGVVVALVLDENGIPDNANDRIEIAKKIYREAAKYGIRQEDIIIDGLAMTISSDPNSAITTLETIRRVRDELHGHSILGVSNISFGLPRRPLINANFFTMAMQNGLSCAIINPNSEAMMASYRSFNALMALDPNDADYIAAYSGTKSQTVTDTKKDDMSLSMAIERGLSDAAKIAVAKDLKTKSAMDIIEGELIPALDIVGKGYEKGELFLPQLLMSAEASKAAFAVIKESMAGQPQAIKGRIILATVKGDIHDIG